MRIRTTCEAAVLAAALAATAAFFPVPRLTLAAASGLCTGTLGQWGWQCETVDAAGDVASLNQFAYGPDGTVHVAYTANVASRGVKYATALKYARRNTGGVWTTQVVDSGTGGPQSLLINPVTGAPVVGYGCLKVAELVETTWSLQTVVNNCGGAGSTFAFDQSATLYAAYAQNQNWRLTVGKRTGTSWSFQTLAPQAGYMSIGIASHGLPAVAFENRARQLVFGHQTVSGAWQFSTVDTASTLVARVTLRFSPTGAATISYRLDQTVRVATQDVATGTWTVETVHAIPSATSLDGISLVYADDEPIITFGPTPSATGTLTFMAAKRSATSGVWETGSIDVIDNSSLIGARVDYNPGSGLLGVSYGPRGSWNDLKFAEGPAAVVGQ